MTEKVQTTRAGVVISLVLGTGIGVLLVEGILQAVLGAPVPPLFNQVPDPILGWRNPHHAVVRNKTRDFDVVVTTNAWSMRDRDRALEGEGKLRIAFLGDSMTQAIQVEDDAVFNRLIEARHPGVEALNFGVSGYGTTQQLLQYRELVRRFRPDVVALMFYPGNDPLDNSVELLRMMSDGWRKRPFARFSEPGEVTFTVPALPGRPSKDEARDGTLPLKRWLAESVWSVHLLVKLKNSVEGLFRGADPGPGGDSAGPATEPVGEAPREQAEIPLEDLDSEVDRRLDAPVWQRAWRQTERLLQIFAEEVSRDGARFVVVVLPIEPIDTKLPIGAVSRTEAHMSDFAAQANIDVIILRPCFRQFLTDNPISPPHLHFEFDGHYRDVGHEVAAQCIVNGLHEAGLAL